MNSSFYKLSHHTPINNKKYALIAPLLGAAFSFFILITYSIIMIWSEHKVLKLDIFNGFLLFLKLTPTLILISLLFSYILAALSFFPFYNIRLNSKWSDGKFWFFNSLVGSIIGLIITFSYSININPFLMFITFTISFLSSLFTASLYTTLIKMRFQNEQPNLKDSSIKETEKSDEANFIKL